MIEKPLVKSGTLHGHPQCISPIWRGPEHTSETMLLLIMVLL